MTSIKQEITKLRPHGYPEVKFRVSYPFSLFQVFAQAMVSYSKKEEHGEELDLNVRMVKSILSTKSDALFQKAMRSGKEKGKINLNEHEAIAALYALDDVIMDMYAQQEENNLIPALEMIRADFDKALNVDHYSFALRDSAMNNNLLAAPNKHLAITSEK